MELGAVPMAASLTGNNCLYSSAALALSTTLQVGITAKHSCWQERVCHRLLLQTLQSSPAALASHAATVFATHQQQPPPAAAATAAMLASCCCCSSARQPILACTLVTAAALVTPAAAVSRHVCDHFVERDTLEVCNLLPPAALAEEQK